MLSKWTVVWKQWLSKLRHHDHHLPKSANPSNQCVGIDFFDKHYDDYVLQLSIPVLPMLGAFHWRMLPNWKELRYDELSASDSIDHYDDFWRDHYSKRANERSRAVHGRLVFLPRCRVWWLLPERVQLWHRELLGVEEWTHCGHGEVVWEWWY